MALSAPLSGQVGGRTAADELCASEARRAGLSGGFVSFLATRDRSLHDVAEAETRTTAAVVNLR